jgi:hypothetical protein
MVSIVFWAIWGALALFMGCFYLRCAHKIRSLLRGTLTGVAALLLLHYLGSWIGFVPEVSLFNLMQAAVLGVPGVVWMTVFHFFLSS